VAAEGDRLSIRWGKFTFRAEHYHFDTFTAIPVEPKDEVVSFDRTTFDVQFRLGTNGEVEGGEVSRPGVQAREEIAVTSAGGGRVSGQRGGRTSPGAAKCRTHSSHQTRSKAMNGSSFSPRLETLGDRLCLSTAGGDVMAVDMFKPGEERGAVDMFKPGEEQGAVDMFRSGEEVGLIGLLRVGDDGSTVDRKAGGTVDFGLLLPAVNVVNPGEEQGAAVDYFGGPYVGDPTLKS